MSLSIERELKNLMSTGKYTLGAKSTIKAVMTGRAKMVIMAKNTPPEVRERILYYAKLGGIPVFTFEGTSQELGVVCGKPFKISSIAVIDEGNSRILELAE